MLILIKFCAVIIYEIFLRVVAIVLKKKNFEFEFVKKLKGEM